MASSGSELKNIARCTRYAFMPNRLHLCGPENQADILEFYSKNAQKKAAGTIQPLLEKFNTLYPYLKLIARSNRISDPFDEEIIDAYWLGNPALENVSANHLFNHVVDAVGFKKNLRQKDFSAFKNKFNLEAIPHHNFHVFSVWRRTGRTETLHELMTMDACRISWGVVKKIKKFTLLVETQPLMIDGSGRLAESENFVEREIANCFDGQRLIENVFVGDYVSIHWGGACEVLTKNQVSRLRKYTRLSLAYAVDFK